MRGAIEARQVTIDGQPLQVAIRRGDGNDAAAPAVQRDRRQLGAGKAVPRSATSDHRHHLRRARRRRIAEAGVAISPVDSWRGLPPNFAAELGYAEIDVAGLSSGAAASRQQFAHQFPKRCRRLALAATRHRFHHGAREPLGAVEDGDTTPLHPDKGYMKSIAADIYGGAFPDDPSLIGPACGCDARRTQHAGYFYQLLAMTGWNQHYCRGCGRCRSRR